MRHFKSSDLVPLDKELERTLRRLNKEKKGTLTLQQRADMEEEATEMEQPRALRDYAMPSVIGNSSSIRRPAIQANNFEIKPAIIQMIQHSVQFSGLPNDDPNTHIANFLEICDTFKQNGVSDDAIRLQIGRAHV